MNLALVGFTHSYNDQQWLAMAEAWLSENEPALSLNGARRFVFDLRGPEGLNFLDDDGLYDVVILFAIYNPLAGSRELERAIGRRRGQTSLAENHSRENWTARLIRTRAKYVLVFRRPDSVDGDWLGEIDGYEKHPDKPGVFGMSIYQLLS